MRRSWGRGSVVAIHLGPLIQSDSRGWIPKAAAFKERKSDDAVAAAAKSEKHKMPNDMRLPRRGRWDVDNTRGYHSLFKKILYTNVACGLRHIT